MAIYMAFKAIEKVTGRANSLRKSGNVLAVWLIA